MHIHYGLMNIINLKNTQKLTNDQNLEGKKQS